jgi:peroxiredoxin
MLRRFKSKGVKSVRIFSTNDKYYADRGWQEDENEDNDCTVM